MFSNFFEKTLNKIGFDDLQRALVFPDRYIIINTLPMTEQRCLIKNTIPYDTEEEIINAIIDNGDFNKKRIIVYGRNTNDETAEKKYNQLRTLGFTEIYLYSGGLFEWLLLQDIYGKDDFPTTKIIHDILVFRPERNKMFSIHH
jgi:hypothetical protein